MYKLFDVADYYDFKYSTVLPRFDNTYLSIANEYRKSQFGFHNIDNVISMEYGEEIGGGLIWERMSNAVFKYGPTNRFR